MGGVIQDKIIPSFDYLVYLFMIISGFVMCNGYYEKFRDGKFDINLFYLKRYKKDLPFFTLLIVFNILIEFRPENLYEGLMEVTLLFGFLPNNSLEVIGVAWTLGVIFAFYVIFPYFVFLIYTKKRAWMALIGSICIVFMCQTYFMTERFVTPNFVNRHSLLYCLPFFIAGGIIYLYKEEIGEFVGTHVKFMIGICVSLTIVYYLIPDQAEGTSFVFIKALCLYAAWVCLALGGKISVMSGRTAAFISDISFEMYLSHMVVFRLMEKLELTRLTGDGWSAYLVTYFLVVIVLIVAIKAYFILKKMFMRLVAAKS